MKNKVKAEESHCQNKKKYHYRYNTHQKYCYRKLEKLNETGEFLEKYILLKFTQKEIESLSSNNIKQDP